MEHRPKANKLAIVSRVFGLVAVLVFSINLFYRHTFYAVMTCIPIVPISSIAVIAGVVADRQIRRSEGSQWGSKIARSGKALGVIAPLLVVVWWLAMLLIGRAF